MTFGNPVKLGRTLPTTKKWILKYVHGRIATSRQKVQTAGMQSQGNGFASYYELELLRHLFVIDMATVRAFELSVSEFAVSSPKPPK